MSSAYTEQDLREAERVAEELAKPKTYWECDWSGETDGTERLTINIPAIAKYLTAEFARIRSEARAGMREACAKHCPMLSLDSNVMWCSCGWRSKESPTEWVEHIRSLPDIAADEAIERIKREARLEEAEWWQEYMDTNRGYKSAPDDPGPKRIAALTAEANKEKT